MTLIEIRVHLIVIAIVISAADPFSIFMSVNHRDHAHMSFCLYRPVVFCPPRCSGGGF